MKNRKNTGVRTWVKTCGATIMPKQRTLNWSHLILEDEKKKKKKKKKMTRVRMERDLKVGILQVYGDHPVVLHGGLENRPGNLQKEPGHQNVPVQGSLVYYLMSCSRSLLNPENLALEAWGRRGKSTAPFSTKARISL